ncbi:RNA-editing complex protein MP42, putative [Bodo saltans]|uniref:RNA-editing complex protein MP42, putative n=1 Tax=Bodo saltans TaxID=75058 RepID=A0A0S4IKI2_BODSA|nr:RNA-editing complex protein MP42, putative [Bodo saltans]|eukprot:CUE63364.1 RNA-editing complex protein MP42, putative [Bodo saltans]
MRRIRCVPQWLQQQTRCIASTAMLRAPEAGYQCSACGKGFRLLNALNHHIATRHAGQAKALSVGADGKTSEAAVAAKPVVPPTPAQSAPQVPKPATPSSMPGIFPGMFPGSGMPVQASTPSPDSSAPTTEEGATTEDTDKRLFVCTICQKTFRLEAALQHHYQAKHGMDMPQANHSTPSSSSATPSKPLSTAFGVNLSSVLEGTTNDAASSSTQYVHAGESSQPSMPQYHLDVAPNAPEEGDLAAHWRLVNHCVLVGTVSEIQEGFVFEDRVLQCLLATDFDNPSPGDPDKDFHTVRVYGSSEALKSMKLIMTPNARVMVSGRLRLVPQFDSITNKYYHHPVVMVPEGSGSVHAV